MTHRIVMAGLVPAILVFDVARVSNVDATTARSTEAERYSGRRRRIRMDNVPSGAWSARLISSWATLIGLASSAHPWSDPSR